MMSDIATCNADQPVLRTGTRIKGAAGLGITVQDGLACMHAVKFWSKDGCSRYPFSSSADARLQSRGYVR